MKTCFVIMPFTKELDALYEKCFEPVIKSNNLKPIVLNKERDGSLVYSQIVGNIQSAFLVIADLTIARPNCYFEVGYAIGQGKQDNLIMCCREDHITDSPQNPRQNDKALLFFNMIKGFLPEAFRQKAQFYFGPILDQHKIHFDLSGYNILLWNLTRKDDFISVLDSEIKKRLQILEARIQNVGLENQSIQPEPMSLIQSKKMTEAEKKLVFDKISEDQKEELKNVKI